MKFREIDLAIRPGYRLVWRVGFRPLRISDEIAIPTLDRIAGWRDQRLAIPPGPDLNWIAGLSQNLAGWRVAVIGRALENTRHHQRPILAEADQVMARLDRAAIGIVAHILGDRLAEHALEIQVIVDEVVAH